MDTGDLAVTLAGMDLEHPIINAAGTCRTLEDVEKFARTSIAAIVVGSVTASPRPENQGVTYYEQRSDTDSLLFTVNSRGMPNGGIPYYENHLPQMVRVAHDAGKKLVLNVAGVSAA
ncbi:MAG: dihydroorotate dehydrogenase, partial [Parcubacteria group bacterium]|nr:dihydroorotate dehydrogenase [Parcubacteria group bacterium]